MIEKSSSRNSPAASELFDEMLVVMAQRGDRIALQRLYRRWNARLMRAARRYCGNDYATQDLAQECWLAILKGLGGLREVKRLQVQVALLSEDKG